MRWQTTLIAAILLAFVGGFYYVYEVRLGPEREKVATRKGRVFAVETGDVTGMELKRPDGVVKAQREGESWQLVTPVKAKAERGPVEETITTIVTAKMDREIDPAPKSLAAYGFAAHPKFTENGFVYVTIVPDLSKDTPKGTRVSRFHVPPRPSGASQRVCGRPPRISIFLSFPFAKNPRNRLSGDQNG